MLKKAQLLLLGLWLAISTAYAQSGCAPGTFFKTYSNPNNDVSSFSIASAPDGGFYAAGRWEKGIQLHKMDASGQFVWSRLLSDSLTQVESFGQIMVDSDSMIVGFALGTHPTTNAEEAFVFRYNPKSNTVEWAKRFPNESIVGGLVQKPLSGHYVLHLSRLFGLTDVIELDRKTGNVIATKSNRFIFNGNALLRKLIPYKDALYGVAALGGGTDPANFRPRVAWMKFDTANNQIVSTRLSHEDTTANIRLIPADFRIDADTVTILYFSDAANALLSPKDVFLQKSTLAGDIIWVKKYTLKDTTRFILPTELERLSDGFAIVGYSGEAKGQLLLLKTDFNGNLKNVQSATLPASGSLIPDIESSGHAFTVNNFLYYSGLSEDTTTNAQSAFVIKTDSILVVNAPCAILGKDSVVVSNVQNPVSTAVAFPFATYTDASKALVFQQTAPKANSNTICTPEWSLGPDVTTCKDTTITLKAGPGYKAYLWQDSSKNQTLATNKSGLYWVEVTDDCGIKTRDSIVLNLNTQSTKILDQTLCKGDSVTVSVPGFDNYAWVPNQGINCNTCPEVVISPDSTTTYRLLAISTSGCLLNDTFTVTVLLPVLTQDTLTACEGDTISLGGKIYLMNDVVVDTIPSTTGGCDTLATYVLQFDPLPMRMVNVNLCEGDSYTVGGATYKQNTTVSLIKPNQTGCDSLITYDIKFAPLPVKNDTLRFCPGDTITFNGKKYTQPVVLTDTIPSTTVGCDTLKKTALVFRPVPTLTDTIAFCPGDTLTIGGKIYTQPATLLDTLPATTGCDTLKTTQLVFKPVPLLFDTIRSCVGDTITFLTKKYTTDTAIVQILAATASCDTVKTTQLIFRPLNVKVDSTLLCAGDTIKIGAVVFKTDTLVTVDTLANPGPGCDTILKQQLIFRPLNVKVDSTLLCAGDTIKIGSVVFKTDTLVTVDTLANPGPGCDTILKRQLIFRPWPVQSDTLSACAGDTIKFQNKVYLKDTLLLVDTLANPGPGCDTLVQKVLKFKPLPIKADTLSACEGDTLLVNGMKYTVNITLIVDTLASATACDTLVQKILIFNPIPKFTDTLDACQGDTVSLGGVKYTLNDTVTINLPAPNGCDTVATYILNFRPVPVVGDTFDLCEGDTLTLNGKKYFKTETVKFKIASTSGGCDTVATYQVNINPRPTRSEIIKFLPGDTVFVKGKPYTAPVIVKDTLPAPGSCDTIVTYTLQWLTTLTLTCPPNLTVTTAPTDTITVVDYDLPVSDSLCPGGNPTITLLKGKPIGGSFGLGETEICYTAMDTCGNKDTCCFKITVVQGEPACDVKKNDCFRWELLPIKLDSLGNRRYRIKVINSCTEPLNYVLFRLPNGIKAEAPADGSVYEDQVSKRKYLVRNPNFSPVYSVRFKADSGTVLKGGLFDIMEYKLPQQSAPKYIYTYAKLADGTYFEAHMNTFNCPEVPWPNFAPDDETETRSRLSQSGNIELFPNPSTGILYLNLEDWSGQNVQIKVMNQLGQTVLENTLAATDALQTLTLPTSLPNGLYHLVVQPKGGAAAAERFVLEKE